MSDRASTPEGQSGGQLQVSPWVCEFQDYLQRKVTITVNFTVSTRALISAVLHRDTGCLWHTIVIGDPANPTYSFACPNDGQQDRTATAAQLASQGLTTIEQAMSLQITAIP